MSVPVVLALGGNVGDVRVTGEAALAQLHETPGLAVEQVSSWYSTEPVGCEGRFLNAAARLHSELTPTQLLLRMHEIESLHGRERTGHWTPRPLDLDLVVFGQWKIEHPRLQVPHPAAWCRRFVLDPVCEVAGQTVHPSFRVTFEALRTRLRSRPLAISWANEQLRDAVIEREILNRFGAQICWVESAAFSIVHFAPRSDSEWKPFEVALPSDLSEARRIVHETLTALLDEPLVVNH